VKIQEEGSTCEKAQGLQTPNDVYNRERNLTSEGYLSLVEKRISKKSQI